MLIELDELYFIPDDWSDITLNEFVEINAFAKKAPKEDATEAEKLEFYIDFIVLFGVSKDEIVKVKIHSEKDDELGIINLFNHLWQFTQMPADNPSEAFESFILNKEIYLFNQDSLDLTGGIKPMAAYTYEEYQEANGILTAMTKVGEGQLEHLGLLCAIFFRPANRSLLNFFRKPVIEEYNEDTVKDRADLFNKELTMDRVFNAYFFLLNRIIGYGKDTATSLLKEVEKNLS